MSTTEWKFEFTVHEDEPLTVERAVFEALGAASVCWDDMSGTGVFQSDRAKQIGDSLLAVIHDCEITEQAALFIQVLLRELATSRKLIRTLHGLGVIGDLTPANQKLHTDWVDASVASAIAGAEYRGWKAEQS